MAVKTLMAHINLILDIRNLKKKEEEVFSPQMHTFTLVRYFKVQALWVVLVQLAIVYIKCGCK